MGVQAIFDLEATNQDLKPLLRDLYITSAKEIEVQGNARKAVVVHVRPRFDAACRSLSLHPSSCPRVDILKQIYRFIVFSPPEFPPPDIASSMLSIALPDKHCQSF